MYYFHGRLRSKRTSSWRKASFQYFFSLIYISGIYGNSVMNAILPVIISPSSSDNTESGRRRNFLAIRTQQDKYKPSHDEDSVELRGVGNKSQIPGDLQPSGATIKKKNYGSDYRTKQAMRKFFHPPFLYEESRPRGSTPPNTHQWMEWKGFSCGCNVRHGDDDDAVHCKLASYKGHFYFTHMTNEIGPTSARVGSARLGSALCYPIYFTWWLFFMSDIILGKLPIFLKDFCCPLKKTHKSTKAMHYLPFMSWSSLHTYINNSNLEVHSVAHLSFC